MPSLAARHALGSKSTHRSIAFPFSDAPASIDDDHLAFIAAGVPSVDVIDAGRANTFPPQWDTSGDTGPALDNVVVTETAATAATKDDCKNDGWKTMKDRLGNGFKNQGDCVSYFATDGRNLGSVTNPTTSSVTQLGNAGRAGPADRPRHAKPAKAAVGHHPVSLDGPRGHTVRS